MRQNRTQFIIVLVDDNISSMRPKMREVRSYLKDMGLELILLEDDENGIRVNDYLKQYDVDIVVTDNSMVEEDSGLQLVEKLKDVSDLYILFYSAITLKIEDYKKLSKHLSVVIVDNNEIVDDLEDLIEKILSLEDLHLTDNEKKILSRLRDCNIQTDESGRLDSNKIFEIFMDLLVENDTFNLAHLWKWISQTLPQPNNPVLEKMSELFGKASYDMLAKFRYRCSKCKKKYMRWPQPNPEHPDKEDLNCHKCGTFDSVEPIG